MVRRVKNLDRDHDIPYLAGYSRDGKAALRFATNSLGLHDQKDGNAGRDRDADQPARPQDPRTHRRRVPAPEMDTEEQQARPLVGAGTERGDITHPLAG